MSLFAVVVIAALITALLTKSHRAGPAVASGVFTLCLLFAAFPTLGSAVTSGTAEFAQQLGGATDRAADSSGGTR